MAAKQQAHIDELVTKNRALEAQISNLQSELTSEKARYEDGLTKVRAQYDAERKQWKDEQTGIQSLWRISYMRLVVQVEEERKAILDLKEELRLSRLATLQLDYKIQLFSKVEAEHEDHVAQLEDDLAAAREDLEDERMRSTSADGATDALTQKLEQQAEQLNEAVSERDQLEVRRLCVASNALFLTRSLTFRTVTTCCRKR